MEGQVGTDGAGVGPFHGPSLQDWSQSCKLVQDHTQELMGVLTTHTNRKEGDDTLSDKQQGMTGFLSTMLRAEARVEDSSDDVSHLLTVVLELIGLLSDALLQGLEKTTLTLRIVGVPGNPDVHKAPARRGGEKEGGKRRPVERNE